MGGVAGVSEVQGMFWPRQEKIGKFFKKLDGAIHFAFPEISVEICLKMLIALGGIS